MMLMAFFHLSTRSLWSFAARNGARLDRLLLRRLIPDLPGDSLVVADAGFVGFHTMKSLIDAGHHLIIRGRKRIKLITQTPRSDHFPAPRTDAQGRYTINAPPGICTVVAMKLGPGEKLTLKPSPASKSR